MALAVEDESCQDMAAEFRLEHPKLSEAAHELKNSADALMLQDSHTAAMLAQVPVHVSQAVLYQKLNSLEVAAKKHPRAADDEPEGVKRARLMAELKDLKTRTNHSAVLRVARLQTEGKSEFMVVMEVASTPCGTLYRGRPVEPNDPPPDEKTFELDLKQGNITWKLMSSTEAEGHLEWPEAKTKLLNFRHRVPPELLPERVSSPGFARISQEKLKSFLTNGVGDTAAPIRGLKELLKGGVICMDAEAVADVDRVITKGCMRLVDLTFRVRPSAGQAFDVADDTEQISVKGVPEEFLQVSQGPRMAARDSLSRPRVGEVLRFSVPHGESEIICEGTISGYQSEPPGKKSKKLVSEAAGSSDGHAARPQFFEWKHCVHVALGRNKNDPMLAINRDDVTFLERVDPDKRELEVPAKLLAAAYASKPTQLPSVSAGQLASFWLRQQGAFEGAEVIAKVTKGDYVTPLSLEIHFDDSKEAVLWKALSQGQALPTGRAIAQTARTEGSLRALLQPLEPPNEGERCRMTLYSPKNDEGTSVSCEILRMDDKQRKTSDDFFSYWRLGLAPATHDAPVVPVLWPAVKGYMEVSSLGLQEGEAFLNPKASLNRILKASLRFHGASAGLPVQVNSKIISQSGEEEKRQDLISRGLKEGYVKEDATPRGAWQIVFTNGETASVMPVGGSARIVCPYLPGSSTQASVRVLRSWQRENLGATARRAKWPNGTRVRLTCAEDNLHGKFAKILKENDDEDECNWYTVEVDNDDGDENGPKDEAEVHGDDMEQVSEDDMKES